jgi:hypothetical protein
MKCARLLRGQLVQHVIGVALTSAGLLIHQRHDGRERGRRRRGTTDGCEPCVWVGRVAGRDSGRKGIGLANNVKTPRRRTDGSEEGRVRNVARLVVRNSRAYLPGRFALAARTTRNVLPI